MVFGLLVLLAGAGLRAPGGTAAGEEAQPGQQAQSIEEERQLGDSIFQGLKEKREILKSSPLYTILSPIAADIVRAAQPRYPLPIHVYLVHDSQPNAYAAPGGNVYVTDELLYFVRNRDELAGTLCHEVSHLIHHDSMAVVEQQMRILRRELGAAILLGPSAGNVLAIALLGKLHSLSYSRDVEARADLTGADVCAASGHNPWGLIWLFGAFENSNAQTMPEFLSDHPDNQRRIEALQEHFNENPQVMSRFSSDPNSAARLSVPADASEVFLR